MITQLTLTPTAVSSFNKDLSNLSLIFDKLTASLAQSVSAFRSNRAAFEHLCNSQTNTLFKMNEFSLVLDGLAYSDNLSSMPSEAYAAVRKYNDILDEYKELCHDIAQGHRHRDKSNPVNWRWAIYVLSTLKTRRINEKVIKAIKRHQNKVSAILEKAEKIDRMPVSNFVEVDGGQLWQTRCKAYDYAI